MRRRQIPSSNSSLFVKFPSVVRVAFSTRVGMSIFIGDGTFSLVEFAGEFDYVGCSKVCRSGYVKSGSSLSRP